MSGELLEKILEYASQRSRYAEARFMSLESRGLSYRNGIFEGMGSSREEGYAVRVVNDSISMGYVDSENWERAREIIDEAVKHSGYPGKNLMDQGSAIRDEWKVEEKKKIEDMSIDDMIELVSDMDKLQESFGASVRMNAVGDRRVSQVYENSAGSRIEGKTSRVSYYYIAGMVEDGEFEQSFEQFGGTGGYEVIDSLHLDERISNDLRDLRESIPAPRPNPGKFDVIVGPEISGIVAHESCGHPTEYDRIIGREGAQAGESFLTGKPDHFRIGSDIVNVIDDPTMKGSYGYYAYDDEGVPARKRYLYRDGHTNEYILNRESAARLGVASNGGGRSASWDLEPLARMSTTYIEPGDYNFNELFEDVKRGIYIKSFTEWNIDDIRFNEKYVGKEAYFIQNGDITGRVRRPIIETNTINFYSSIDAIGKDLQFNAGTCGKGDPEQGVDVWMGGPHLRLRNLYIQ